MARGLDVVDRLWSFTSVEGRLDLLTSLKIVCSQHPDWMGGKSAQQLANTCDIYSLPVELQGRLIMTATEDGWPIKRHKYNQFVLTLCWYASVREESRRLAA